MNELENTNIIYFLQRLSSAVRLFNQYVKERCRLLPMSFIHYPVFCPYTAINAGMRNSGRETISQKSATYRLETFFYLSCRVYKQPSSPVVCPDHLQQIHLHDPT